MKQPKKPTTTELLTAIQDVLVAVNNFASYTEQRFQGIDQRFAGIDRRFDKFENDVSGINSKLFAMVTKDYLDEKLANLRGDLVSLTRKEDNKLKFVVTTLRHKKVFTDHNTKQILALEPFAFSR